ncbi:MAG TPA: AAA family ATPase, partial [Spirochaetota bacterium]|nr:AAA family ATPase [Spirochaetota bacterium]
MSENLQHIYRSLADILPQAHERKIVLITGARQTGKTTLAKKRYAQLKYINLDSPEMRDSIRKVAASDWDKDVGIAVLDEAQKEPTIFEKIKYSYDEMSLPFSVILGSSQILLLKNIRESLAGRIWLYELWPLMMSEMAAGSRRAEKPLLGAILEADSIDTVLTAKPSILIGNENTIKKKAEDYLLQWGGMPALIHLESDN